MKAVIVIDMPSKCSHCPLYSEDDYGYGCGYATLTDRRRTPVDYKKPSWCPLRPLPEKLTWGHSMEYTDGYNACLEEIRGEKE